MKYTKEHLYQPEKQEKYLGYINLVMKDITIKKDTKIVIEPDGGIELRNKKQPGKERLFSHLAAAHNKMTYRSHAEDYLNFIELKQKQTVITSIFGEGE